MLETDPIDLLLDADGDIDIGTDAAFSSGIDGVAQGVRIAMQMIRGEWFLNLDEGIPYFVRDGVTKDEALLGQRFNRRLAFDVFTEGLKRAPGVERIVSLEVEFDRDLRKLVVRWVVSTAFGDTEPDALFIGVD